MSATIWKYQLAVTDDQSVWMPDGAQLLTVQVQGGVPCLWALILDVHASDAKRWIEIFGTGNPIPQDMGVERKYIATFQLHGGALVFHVFERIN